MQMPAATGFSENSKAATADWPVFKLQTRVFGSDRYKDCKKESRYFQAGFGC